MCIFSNKFRCFGPQKRVNIGKSFYSPLKGHINIICTQLKLSNSYHLSFPKEIASCKSLLFADDGKLFRIIKCIADCLLLQHDIDLLCKWCDTWKISLNASKCYFLPFTNKRSNKINFTYTLNGTVVSQVNVMRDLGVYFTSNFCFRYHVEEICEKS